jgi:hypothetical protein
MTNLAKLLTDPEVKAECERLGRLQIEFCTLRDVSR